MFGVPAGAVLGHEFAGEIAALGKGVTGLKVGDRVSVPPVKGCGECGSCRAGEPAWCAQMSLIGGGYGEYALALERQIVRLPSSASLADGALVEPLAVALQRHPPVEPADRRQGGDPRRGPDRPGHRLLGPAHGRQADRGHRPQPLPGGAGP